MKLLLLFALVGTSLAMTVLNGTSRMINGVNVNNINQAPWMASIQANGNHICGATIIDKRWLLTSAACISG